MTRRLTEEEKEERAHRRRMARALAKKLAKAKDDGRYIVCYNQAQLDATIALVKASDAFTPKLCVFLELRHGVFIIDGAVKFEVDQLLVVQGAHVGFKTAKLEETAYGGLKLV